MVFTTTQGVECRLCLEFFYGGFGGSEWDERMFGGFKGDDDTWDWSEIVFGGGSDGDFVSSLGCSVCFLHISDTSSTSSLTSSWIGSMSFIDIYVGFIFSCSKMMTMIVLSSSKLELGYIYNCYGVLNLNGEKFYRLKKRENQTQVLLYLN